MKEKQEKRARDFIRFGKRNVEEYDDIDAEDDYENMNPSKRYGRRRISNFLRFGWIIILISPLTRCVHLDILK